ncbi:AAA family ATPase [uncultured Acetatifactor sp.]|uniref:AAA family ATPase n=1 Tax=uncultured Acetatifactor sp. TaxID=1671927 RepID=UPI0026289607|nr:AAA family ATPase [uncultured Acetatifactor sp.]
MRIKSLVVDGIGGIQHLELQFIDSMNVICGANGIGKTTILDIISDAFSSNISSKLKRNALCEKGSYFISISDIENQILEKTEDVEKFQPNAEVYRGGWEHYSNNLLYFGIDRNINYAKLESVTSDPEREDYIVGQMAVNGIQANDIKNWFVNRYLFVDKKGSLTYEQIENYKLAEKAFGVLDDTVNFETVIARTYDIMLTTSKGDIYFEYLSSGYKSCIYIIFGIIKEIEYRTSERPVQANKFAGVVLIDEVDLHLHPIWQAGLIKALKAIFPYAQFILTTHSPSVLQILEKEEIIALGYNEKGDTYLKELNLGKYGLQGWTLEEILKYVMEMPATTSGLYQETLAKFDDAMNKEDKDLILQQYNILREMLHSCNPLQKLLAIQVAEWED